MFPSFPTTPFPTPATAGRRGAFVATVKENRRICTDHYRLILNLQQFPVSVPGQFVQIDCGDPHRAADHDLTLHSFEWPPAAPAPGATLRSCCAITDPDFNAPLPYLRRPFSIAEQHTWPDGYTELHILHRVVGKGTLQLAALRPGQKISILGPLGGGFTVPPTLAHACLVGGGVGIPPMFYLASALAKAMVQESTAFIGAQRHDLLPITLKSDLLPPNPEGDPLLNVEEFAEFNYPAVITTDDGSLGMKGYVTDALRRFLQKRLEKNGNGGGLENVIVYCCGPTPMMKATARVAAAFNVPCQVSLEQPMACGMGTCQSCVIRYKPHDDPNVTDWKYKLTCTDGPVFDSRDIVW